MHKLCRQLQSDKSVWTQSPHSDATFAYVPANNEIEGFLMDK